MTNALSYSIRQRVKAGLSHTVYGLSGNVANFVFSVVIIRIVSPALWGSFAQLLLILMLFSQITNWGNKEYLLREFSRQGRLSPLWQTSLLTRLLTLLFLSPLVFIFPLVDIDPAFFCVWMLSHFLYRSFDSLVVFERKFHEAIWIEAAGFSFILILILWLQASMTLSLLVLLFIGSNCLKLLAYCILFYKPFLQTFAGRFELRHLVRSLPYLLPSLIGFTQAKADTLVISIRLSRQELGEYYVLMSLLSYCHAIPVLIITPFLKNLYRINPGGFKKVRRSFMLAGVPWSLFCIVCIYAVMEWVYHFTLPWINYGIAWLALPPYFVFYLLSQQFLRDDRPYTIVVLSAMAAALNFIASFVLIDRFGFTGGLMACAGLQWVIMLLYLLLPKKSASVSPIYPT